MWALFLSPLSIALTLVILGVSSGAAAATATASESRRAVANGDDVTDLTKYPYFARVDIDGVQGCGGSLIHREFVLSAAHCFPDPNEVVTVFFESLQWTDRDPTKQAQVLEIITHPQYDGNSAVGGYDVALIRIAPVTLSSTVSTIQWNDDPNLVTADDEVTLIGYGEDETLSFPDILQEVTLFIRSDEDCNAQYEAADGSGIASPLQICALDAALNEDACAGDSGGPLIYKPGNSNDPSQHIQVGIVELGLDRPCGDPAAPGVYAEVSTFSEWIQEQICEKATVDIPADEVCKPATTPPGDDDDDDDSGASCVRGETFATILLASIVYFYM